MKRAAFIVAVLGCLSGATGAFGELTLVKIDQSAATPGMVLQHNVHYVVKGNVEIDASGFPATSAIRVPVGVSAVIEIPKDHLLTVTGGPGYGRLPGGCGIEVPRGAKLVLTGEGTLRATGGAAAAGGTGYGGMGGMSGALALDQDVPPEWLADGVTPPPPAEYEVRNGICVTNFLSSSLDYNFTGTGGTGGDGGGGASPAIGGRGGAGGMGGTGAPGRFFIHEDIYNERPKDYEDCVTFFGLAAPCVYTDDSPIAYDGGAGSPGGDGFAGGSCGEIVFAGNLQTELTAGGGGAGGHNGPYGSTFSDYDEHIGLSADVMNLNIASCVLGFTGTVLGIGNGASGAWTVVSSGIGAVSGVLSIASMILDSMGVAEKNKMKKMVWFIGGGGGGGGAGGGKALNPIGAGGSGGGGGGGGGSGFFERGVGSVYHTTGLGKPDVTETPLQLSGHGGFGGQAAVGGKAGWAASSDAGGQVKLKDHKDKDNHKVPYNADNGRIGAWSWKDDDVWGWSGAGASGGLAGPANTNAANVITVEDGKYCHAITFGDGTGRQETLDYLCGTLIERAPVTASERQGTSGTEYFNGYYTASGRQVFDRYSNPVGYPQLTSDLSLTARWTAERPLGGITKVVKVKTGGKSLSCTEDTIFVFEGNCVFANDNGAALSIPEGRRVVLSIPLLTTVSFKGSDGNGTTPGYPGIEVPSNSTLIVIGEGTLSATGGNAGRGSAGLPGENGKLEYDGDDVRGGYSGTGGVGGAGGGGAGAGIGGAGGTGGCGGTGGEKVGFRKTSGDWEQHSGKDGAQGGGGSAGVGMGTLYLLGTVSVTAMNGMNDGIAASGGSCGGWEWCNRPGISTHEYGFFGGGGGGGGGAGMTACGIGGGGGGAGGGGGGGSGKVQWKGDSKGDIAKVNGYGYGGSGGLGSIDGGIGGTGSGSDRYEDDYKVGKGGAGGTNGVNGATGPLFCGLGTLQVNPEISKSYAGDIQLAYGHEALERTMTFTLCAADGTELKSVTVLGQIGMPLPLLPTNCTQGVRGYVMEGAYEVRQGATNWWYGTDGEALKEAYEGYDDVTLTVSFVPDYAHMADVPPTLSCVYDNTNYVAFAAKENPGCQYVSGVTNAINAGSYSYDVRLGDGYTIWRDLSTEDARTVNWEVRKAPITNEWAACNIAYDWTKSPEGNAEWLQANGLDFDLPDGATVSFEKGRRIQVNVEELIAHIDGGSNYLSRTMYGSYSCLQPFQLKLRSYYPWEAKLDISYSESSIVASNVVRKAFLDNYGTSNIVVEAVLAREDGSVDVILLDDTKTVLDVDQGAYSRSAYSLVDLGERLAGRMDGNRCAALPVRVSIAGQVFQGGSVSVDVSAVPRPVDDAVLGPTNFPSYTVHDVKDIYDVLVSCLLTDDPNDIMVGLGDQVYPMLAIGEPEKPGERFRPQTATGAALLDGFVSWKPTAAGTYMLEHFVTNKLGRAESGEPYGITGYRRAYFNVCGAHAGEDPVLDRPDVTVVEVVHAATGKTEGFNSLNAALKRVLYGDTVRIVGDVQAELETLPSGTLMVVGDWGVIRNPAESYIRYPYNTMSVVSDLKPGEKQKVLYLLDESKVVPSFVSVDATTANALPFGVFDTELGRFFNFTIGNVKPDLYYIVRRSDDIRTWTTVKKVFANGTTKGAMSISVPAEGDAGFYSVAVTDEPSPPFQSADDGQGGVTLTGITAVSTVATDGKLVLPAEIYGKPVTGVSSDAFDGTGLTELTLPASVTSFGCVNLPDLKMLRFLGDEPQIPAELSLPAGCMVYVPQVESWKDLTPDENWHGAQLEYWVDFQVSNTVEGTVSILGCGTVPPDGRLRIPATIGGRPVTAIADAAFANRSEVRTLVLPEGLAEIGYSAFAGCPLAGELDIPASVTFIGAQAFASSQLTALRFVGDRPETFGDVGLDPANCTIYVSAGSSGWGETWQGCKVCPVGYRLVNYVESTGQEYIDTKIDAAVHGAGFVYGGVIDTALPGCW